MTSTAPSAIVRNALKKAGLTISKKTRSRVPGLPLISRGYSTWSTDETVYVQWESGSYRNDSDRERALSKAVEVLSQNPRLRVTRDETFDRITVTRAEEEK